MKAEALKLSVGAYLRCLFLMMANKRYTPVKMFLHEAFLVENQQYPCNVLAMKRFVANFIGVDAGKPKCPQQQQPKAYPVGRAGNAFSSPKKKTFPVCHAYRKQHDGGHLKCRSITDEHHKRIDELVKAGAFDDKGGGSSGNTTTLRTTGRNKPTK